MFTHPTLRHTLNSGTGTGKTQFALQVALHAAKHGTPVVYIGLELGELDLALRLLGEEARVPWSRMWTGKAGPAYIVRARNAAPALSSLPFHYEVGRPHGFPASAILSTAEGMRAEYPETDGPGSLPVLLVVDFLQLIGDEPADEQELRIRIGRASYTLREIANRMGFAVLAISSVARDRVKLLADIRVAAGLCFDEDHDGCPINRGIRDPEAIIGVGKESGDIEFSADSVSILAKVSETWTGNGSDVIVATAKGRATGAAWTPLHFTGFGYEECSDRGGRIVEAWKGAVEKRGQAKTEKAAKKEQAQLTKLVSDASAVAAYLMANPGCAVRAARLHAVGDNSARWARAMAKLGSAVLTSDKKKLTVDRTKLPEDVRTSLGLSVEDERGVETPPPYPPLRAATEVGARAPPVEAAGSVEIPHSPHPPRNDRARALHGEGGHDEGDNDNDDAEHRGKTP